MQASRETLDWVMTYYDAIDANDIETAMRYFTPDARCRFGNGPFVVGAEAIRADFEAKSGAFKSLRHEFINIWEAEEGVLVLEADAFFTLHDGAVAQSHGAAIFRFKDQQWTEQLHFSDTSAAFTVTPATA